MPTPKVVFNFFLLLDSHWVPSDSKRLKSRWELSFFLFKSVIVTQNSSSETLMHSFCIPGFFSFVRGFRLGLTLKEKNSLVAFLRKAKPKFCQYKLKLGPNEQL